MVQVGVDGGGNVGKRGLEVAKEVECQLLGGEIGTEWCRGTSVNYDVCGTLDEFDSWFGLNLLYR
jgi:hypothetical protein